MPIETEHKYLVNKERWSKIIPQQSYEISQGYLYSDKEKTIRVRTKGEKGFITVKGKTVNASRLEYEYEIPLNEAKEMVNTLCGNVIEKTRHILSFEGKIWEVDEFKGLNAGLMVAEIELTHEDEEYHLPDWIEKNVTDDIRFANSNLAIKPFSLW